MKAQGKEVSLCSAREVLRKFLKLCRTSTRFAILRMAGCVYVGQEKASDYGNQRMKLVSIFPVSLSSGPAQHP